ncbi:hypothetical protein EUV02_01550 [Polymorphobacter arshaanensis]|uniref:Uncharacterized protein n=1 Tax=Glacieibacterium arshaanense TaxID=2511025 RepID=A0A4Y9EQX7_9SPHN|nr:hypothetical protein [Polymorphobacter arshaanensis]TFU05740.1 hypothetical protein EUV02_01550 [Polymorphobacter arshaanensis]
MSASALRRTLVAALVYFAVVFAAGFVFGIVRTLLLMPRIGALPAVMIEAPLILAVSWLVCGRVLAHWAVPPQWPWRLLMSATAFALLIAAEMALARVLNGSSPAEFVASYTGAAARLGLAAQLLFAVVPLLRRR